MKYKQIVTTLYEGHYHYGVAVLINSLIAASFEGLINIGYRDEKPNWTEQFKQNEEGNYYYDKVIICFEHLNPPMHFGYYKPSFLKKMLADYPLCEKVYYFDPDIVVNCSWKFYSEWPESGVALCLDCCYPLITKNHPWRTRWKALAPAAYTKQQSEIEYYINSGFIGLKRNDSALLQCWIDITDNYSKSGGSIQLFEKDDPMSAFKGDQDMLNAAITVLADTPFSIIGKEGMGFTEPANLMLHALPSPKPWKSSFLKSAVKGSPPSLAEKGYWAYAHGPIKLYSDFAIFRKKLLIKILALTSRFYKKN